MPITYKVLGQSNPAAVTPSTLYTVPASTQTVVSTITATNIGTTVGTFRIAIRPAGATLANQHYLVYDAALNGSDMVTFTLGITLATTDVITIYASSANFTFQAFGSELT